MNQNKCNPHCAPFIIYIILGIVSLISTIMRPMDDDDNKVQTKITAVVVQAISIFLFGLLLYWLCYNCHTTIAWVILLLPVILFIFLLLVAIGLVTDIMSKKNDENRS